jgi:hypothetical protein
MKDLKKAGVDIIDPKTGKEKNALSIIKEIAANKKLMKPGALLDALGEEKAARAMRAVIENMEEVERLKNDSVGSNQVQLDALEYQNSAAGKMEATWERIKNKTAEVFTPDRVDAFAAALVKVGTAVEKIIGGIEEVIHAIEWLRKTSGEEGADIAGQYSGLDPDQMDRRAALIEQSGNSDAAKGASAIQGILGGDLGGLFMPAAGTVASTAGHYNGDAQRTAAAQMHRTAGGRREMGSRQNAMAAGGFGTGYAPVFNLKVGAEPMVAATANSMDHLRNNGTN